MPRSYKPFNATAGLTSSVLVGESAHRVGLWLVSQSNADSYSVGLGEDAVGGRGVTLIGAGHHVYLDKAVIGELLTRRLTIIGSAAAVAVAGYEVLDT